MPSVDQREAELCAQFSKVVGQPCSEALLPSVYQAALTHAGPYGHGRAVSHTPWEAVTFVAVSTIVLVAYMAVLGYLATRALRQVPRLTSASPSGFIGLTDTRIVYDTKKDQCRHPQPADVVDTPEGSFDV